MTPTHPPSPPTHPPAEVVEGAPRHQERGHRGDEGDGELVGLQDLIHLKHRTGGVHFELLDLRQQGRGSAEQRRAEAGLGQSRNGAGAGVDSGGAGAGESYMLLALQTVLCIRHRQQPMTAFPAAHPLSTAYCPPTWMSRVRTSSPPTMLRSGFCISDS